MVIKIALPLHKSPHKQDIQKLHVKSTHQFSSDKIRKIISLYLIKQGCKTFDSVLKMLKNIQSYIKLMVTYVTFMQIIGIDFSFPCTTVILFSIGLTKCKLLTANYIELNKKKINKKLPFEFKTFVLVRLM